MTVWPASFFFLGGASGICRGYNRPLRFPQPARANQSGLCLEHHPSPSHNLLRHGDPFHSCLSGIPAWRSILLTGFRHGDPFPRYLRGIPAWRTASRPVHDRQLTDALTGLRHGDPFHRCLSGILTWRRWLLSTLWHGNPSHRYLRAIPAWRTASHPVHDRQLTDALTGLRHGYPAHG